MNEYADGMVELHLGHVLDVLPRLLARSVQCVVTSPPYWGLRDYKVPAQAWGGDQGHEHEWGAALPHDPRHRYTAGQSGKQAATAKAAAFPQGRGQLCACGAWLGQLGLEPSFDAYLEHAVGVFAEVRRVLRDDGVLWLNMGDCYVSNPKGPGGDDKSTLTPSGVRAQRAEHLHGRRTAGLKPKDLVGQPWRLAFALQEAGWWLRMDVVWSKPNPMPESVYDRPTRAHEYVFLMTKAARYFYDAIAIQEPTTGTAHPRGREGAERGAPAGWGHLREPGGPDEFALGERTAANNPAGLNPKAAANEPGSRQNESFTLGITPQRRPQAWDESRGSVRELIDGYDRVEPGLPQKFPAGWDRVGHGREGFGRFKNDKQAATGAASDAVRGGDTYSGFNERWREGESTHLALRNSRSVWTIPTQPYPEAHFATFPEELPRRCILAGTSARGACPECGAPWRRLSVSGSGTGFDGPMKAKGRPDGAERHHLRGGQADWNTYEPAETVAWVPGCGCGTGLAADAFELIGTPLAERDEGYEDPSLEVGRAGFARPRVEGEGLSWMTRHEQRQYALQLRELAAARTPEVARQMRQEAGEGAFGHYARTDYPNGARAIPAALLDAWLEVGWLWRAESPFDRVAQAPAPVPCVVLDPFAGSGTTLAVAKSLDRRSVGVEVGPDYLRLIADRVGKAAAQLSMSEVL